MDFDDKSQIKASFIKQQTLRIMQKNKIILAVMALVMMPSAVFAQYPKVTKEAQAKLDSLEALWTAH